MNLQHTPQFSQFELAMIRDLRSMSVDSREYIAHMVKCEAERSAAQRVISRPSLRLVTNAGGAQ